MLSGLKSLLFSVKQRRYLFPMKSKRRRSPLIKRRSHHYHFNQFWQHKSCNDGEEICQNVCCPFRVFAVLIISSCAELRLLVTLPRKTIHMRRFRLKTDDLMENARRNQRPHCTFLCRYCTTTTWKCLISRSVEDGNTRQQLSFSCLNLIQSFRIQLQKNLPTCIWRIKRDGISAINFEAT